MNIGDEVQINSRYKTMFPGKIGIIEKLTVSNVRDERVWIRWNKHACYYYPIFQVEVVKRYDSILDELNIMFDGLLEGI